MEEVGCKLLERKIVSGMLIKGIDGVATGFKPNHIFKIPNKMNIKILKNG